MEMNDFKDRWALVTGASSGIGREFCKQLAAAGVNLVMVARREAAMSELAQQLITDYRIQVLVLPFDLSQANAGKILKERVAAGGVQIKLLVNNAASGRWGRFEETPPEVYEEMIYLNTTALVTLCHYFREDLTADPGGAIINVSSGAAYQPVPYMAVYGATKAFVHGFSQALYGEWRDHGVHVQTLVPGPTQTEFDVKAGAYESKIQERDSPEIVVKTSLMQLGKDDPLSISAKGTYKQRFFAGLFPAKMVIKTVAKMFHPPDGQKGPK